MSQFSFFSQILGLKMGLYDPRPSSKRKVYIVVKCHTNFSIGGIQFNFSVRLHLIKILQDFRVKVFPSST